MALLNFLKTLTGAQGETTRTSSSGGGGSSGSGVTGDPHYGSVLALIDAANTTTTYTHFDRNFIDLSTNSHTMSLDTGGTGVRASSLNPYFPPEGYNSVYYSPSNIKWQTVPYDASFKFGSGDFTLECFVNVTAFTTYGTIATDQPNDVNGAGTYFWRINNNTNQWQFQIGSGTGYTGVTINSSTDLTVNTWHHIAVTRSGSSIKLWQDGVEVGSGTSSVDFNNTQTLYIGSTGASYQYTGYISNFRIVKGTAVYTSAFTTPTSPLTDISGTGLLCCQSKRYVDRSSNAHTVSPSSQDPLLNSYYPSSFQLDEGNDPTKYGGSYILDSSTNYQFKTPGSAAFNYGTGDFTWEGWIRPNSLGTSYWLDHASNGAMVQFYNGVIRYYPGASDPNGSTFYSVGFGSTDQISLGAWHHLAVSRVSGTTYLFLDGKLKNSGTDTTNLASNYAVTIGEYGGNIYPFDGYMADIRITKGAGLYTADFDLPTQKLTATSQTSLLLQPDLGIVEKTGKHSQFHNYGSTSVDNYSQHLHYASYFDGLGDYLSIADDASLELGSSSFTLEMWYKGTDTDQYATLTSTTVANFTVGHWSLMMNHTNTGDIAFYFGDYSTSGPLLITTTPSVVDNRWHHIALVRNGNSWVLYIDGISRATATSSAASTDDSGGLYIGYDARYGRDLSGYITDFRLVKGTAVYTSAFTPPNVPLTAISGTSLLISTDQATVQDSSTNSHTVTVNGTVSSTKEYNSKETKVFDIDAAIDFNTNDYIKLGWGKGYIDGDSSGTYQNTSDNNIFHNNGQIYNLQDKDFTIEFWFKRESVTESSYADAILCNAVGIRGIGIAINPTGYTGISYSTSAGSWAKVGADPGNTFGNIQIELGKWYHYAVVRDGSNGYQYINGVRAETFTFSGSLTDWNGGVFLGHWHDGNARLFNGQIAQLRFTKGVARYTDTVFDVPTTKFFEKYGSASSGSATTLATDAYFANTVFLQSANTLPANTSVNNNETILDKSTNSLTVTLNGDTKVKPFNPYTPVGEWSIDYTQTNVWTYWTNPSAAIPPQIAWLDGASDNGTFETWVYMTQTQGSGSNANAAAASMFQVGTVYIQFSILSTGAVRYYWWTGSQNWIDTTTTLKPHQWHHIALTRDGTDIKIYIDGVLARSHSSYTGISWGSASGGQTLYHGFGGNTSESVYFKGYMSNMRSSDSVRYTGTFNVPTEKFTSDANTLYLSHDNNKRKSRDTNGYQLVNGNASAFARTTSFAPYDSSVPYQNEVGCIEFDGTGDSIDIEAGNHFVTDFGSSDDVTWEGWVYLRASQNSQLWGNTSRTSQVLIHTTLYFYAYGFQGTARSFATELYEWHHIAAVRSSGTVYIYVDGVLHDSGAGTGVHNNTSTMRIGERGDGYNDMNGYVADVHWMQGYAKYTSAFTPPASPVSIHSNTVTKLPFNDLSFYDATENSSLESSSTSGSAAWPIGRHIKYATYHPYNTAGWYSVAETAANEFTFGTGDLTMECFFLAVGNHNATYSSIMTTSSPSGSSGPLIALHNNTGIMFRVGSGTWSINVNLTPTNPPIQGRWNHIAYARENDDHRLYLNGDLIYSVNKSFSAINTDGVFLVGGRSNASQYFNGYIGDVRVVKGTALYTTPTINVPYTGLTEVTNTVFLQKTSESTLKDSSTNPLTITATAGMGSYTNFKTTLQVATTPLSFDGSSYINIEDADNIIGKFGTQDFTIEAYVWRHAAGIYGSWLASDHSGFNNGAIFFRFGSSSSNPSSDNNGKFHVGWHGVGDSFIQTTNTYADHTWHHYVLVRSGNSFTQYVNGLIDGTATSSNEFNLDAGSGIRLGQSTWDGSNGYFNGMISQLRITVGNVRYSGPGFIVPDNYFPAKKP